MSWAISVSSIFCTFCTHCTQCHPQSTRVSTHCVLFFLLSAAVSRPETREAWWVAQNQTKCESTCLKHPLSFQPCLFSAALFCFRITLLFLRELVRIWHQHLSAPCTVATDKGGQISPNLTAECEKLRSLPWTKVNWIQWSEPQLHLGKN